MVGYGGGHQGAGPADGGPDAAASAEVPRPPDVADALALAVCHLTTIPLRRAVARAARRIERPTVAGR